jgi:hypothetical protein
MKTVVDKVIDEVIGAYDGVPNVQARFKYKDPMGVYNWRSRGIPKAFVADIHLDTGIAIERLLEGVKAPKPDNTRCA